MVLPTMLFIGLVDRVEKTALTPGKMQKSVVEKPWITGGTISVKTVCFCTEAARRTWWQWKETASSSPLIPKRSAVFPQKPAYEKQNKAIGKDVAEIKLRIKPLLDFLDSGAQFLVELVILLDFFDRVHGCGVVFAAEFMSDFGKTEMEFTTE